MNLCRIGVHDWEFQRVERPYDKELQEEFNRIVGGNCTRLETGELNEICVNCGKLKLNYDKSLERWIDRQNKIDKFSK